MSQYFHFTLGPVQGFVSQARRTRDFWAGSFLLSWLSGVAMAATKKMGGEIVFPVPPKDYLDWIVTGNGAGEPPRQGSIPNRFKAEVPEGFDGRAVEQAVRDAWLALAQHVLDTDLQGVAGDASRAVWDRQHKNFWEISWAVTQEDAVSNLLDRRKNWRNHLPPPEPGVKCSIMEGWQELSGIEGMSRDDNGKRAAFWEAVRDKSKNGAIDFAENEMLCGLAFVKRRFARHFGRFSTSLNLDWASLSLKGWALETGMPSVAYMAAVHWLKDLVGNNEQSELARLYEAGQKIAGRDEWDVRIKCLRDAAPGGDKRRLIALDGNLFFEHARTNKKFFENRDAVSEFEKVLKNLKLTEKSPSPFYAILLMDGDSLGVQMGSKENQTKIANSLNAFTDAVPGAVQDNNGFLIYAGGDDVLALLPLEDALPCALACRNAYAAAFSKHGAGVSTTLSGAVLFAHVKTALGEVLRQSHEVLDDIAKDGAGRDAIAVRALKPGGDHWTWAQPWEVALGGQKELVLEKMAEQFRTAEGKDKQFSSKFFYRIRERFSMLEGGLDGHQQIALLAADYIASDPAKQNGEKMTIEQAKQIIAPLLEQCTPHQRLMHNNQALPRAQWHQSKKLSADGALLVRFLANKGIEVR